MTKLLLSSADIEHFQYSAFSGLQYQETISEDNLHSEILAWDNDNEMLQEIKEQQLAIDNSNALVRFFYYLFNINDYAKNAYKLALHDALQAYQAIDSTDLRTPAVENSEQEESTLYSLSWAFEKIIQLFQSYQINVLSWVPNKKVSAVEAAAESSANDVETHFSPSAIPVESPFASPINRLGPTHASLKGVDSQSGELPIEAPSPDANISPNQGLGTVSSGDQSTNHSQRVSPEEPSQASTSPLIEQSQNTEEAVCAEQERESTLPQAAVAVNFDAQLSKAQSEASTLTSPAASQTREPSTASIVPLNPHSSPEPTHPEDETKEYSDFKAMSLPQPEVDSEIEITSDIMLENLNTLGIQQDLGSVIPLRDIKIAFNKKAFLSHPDRNKSENADEEFNKIKMAYSFFTASPRASEARTEQEDILQSVIDSNKQNADKMRKEKTDAAKDAVGGRTEEEIIAEFEAFGFPRDHIELYLSRIREGQSTLKM